MTEQETTEQETMNQEVKNEEVIESASEEALEKTSEETPNSETPEANELSSDDKAQDTSENNEYYGAPENYDFKNLELPEGITIDDKLTEKFTPALKELNLSQKSADKLAHLLAEYQQAQTENAEEQLAEFKRQEKAALKMSYEKMLNSDKEIGVDEAQRNAYIDVADVGYKAFANDDFKGLLQELHLDYHPAVIKHFYRLGKLCGNDKILSSSTPQVPEMSRAEILYPTNYDNK